jgi:hypothetical protein
LNETCGEVAHLGLDQPPAAALQLLARVLEVGLVGRFGRGPLGRDAHRNEIVGDSNAAAIRVRGAI